MDCHPKIAKRRAQVSEALRRQRRRVEDLLAGRIPEGVTIRLITFDQPPAYIDWDVDIAECFAEVVY